jgi:hypothetical protein
MNHPMQVRLIICRAKKPLQMRRLILGKIRRVSVKVGKLPLLLLRSVVEVDAESAPTATSVEDTVLDRIWDRCASSHGLNLEIVL